MIRRVFFRRGKRADSEIGHMEIFVSHVWTPIRVTKSTPTILKAFKKREIPFFAKHVTDDSAFADDPFSIHKTAFHGAICLEPWN
jgi:hypothetical protein